MSTQALSTLPSGSSPFTVAAWIKCDASTITSSKPSSVAVAWGSPEVSTSATFSAATLSVSSVERGPSVYWVSTLAGTGGSGSNDGTGTAASFQYIRSIVSTKSGMVQYALENTGNRIRKITNPGGIVTTIPVTGLQNCYGASLDTTEQYLWLTELSRSRILRLDLSTNTLETKAGWNYWSFIDNADGTNAGFTYPYDLTIGGDGNVYVADMYAQRIRKIAVSNNFRVTTFAGSGSSGFSDGIGQTARFRNPRGTCSDGTSLYVLDSSSHTVRKITISSQEVTTLAGMPGSWGYTDNFGTNARFYSPTSITYGNGFVYVGDINNGYRIRRVDVSTRQVTTFAGSGSYGNANGIATSASFNYFEDLSADEKGNVYVADGNNYLVRKISKVPGLPGGLPVCDSNWHHIALTYTGGASTAKTLTA